MTLTPRPHADRPDDAIFADLAALAEQVRELERQVERGEPTPVLLAELASVISSARAVGLLVLETHLRRCLVEDHRPAAARIADIHLALDAGARLTC